MRLFRGLMALDVVFTLIGAAMALATPEAFAAGYMKAPLAPPGEVFVRWLGLMFVVCAAVEARGLQRGDVAFWRVVLPAFVLGDAMHLASSLWRVTQPGFHATSTSIADLAVVLVYFPLRAWLALHPDRLATK